MRNCVEENSGKKQPAEMAAWSEPELTGPLGNLARLLFSEAWRAKARTTNLGAFVDLTNLSRDFMRRNVAANHNIPQIALSQ
jgi:hypothetical protein